MAGLPLGTALSIWPWQLSRLGFDWPAAFVGLLILPILAGVYVWMQTRRRRYAIRYASVSLVREAVGRGPGVRRHLPAAMYLLALAVMIVALARPRATHPTAVSTGTVVLAIDVSGSMRANDVMPNRMEATKQAVRDFVQKQPKGVNIGVVSFSNFGALVAPPTRDRKQVSDAINRLQPQQGTNIGGGLEVALDAIYEEFDAARASRSPTPGPGGALNPGPGVQPPTPVPSPSDRKLPAATIVLLSDGQSNTGPAPLRVADEAARAGVRVNTVGIGTTQGTVLHIQGRNVFTRLDEETLKGIADATGGRYFSAQDESQLKSVYGELARERQTEDKETELTYAVTGVALVLSVIAGGFSLLWFNRLP